MPIMGNPFEGSLFDVGVSFLLIVSVVFSASDCFFFFFQASLRKLSFAATLDIQFLTYNYITIFYLSSVLSFFKLNKFFHWLIFSKDP